VNIPVNKVLDIMFVELLVLRILVPVLSTKKPELQPSTAASVTAISTPDSAGSV
jgi:hypothetical protein